MRKLFTLLIVACAVLQTFAQGPRRAPGDVIYSEDFNNGLPEDFINYANAGNAWEATDRYMSTNAKAQQIKALYTYPGSTGGKINVWGLIPIHLSANVPYNLSYVAWQESTSYSFYDVYAFILPDSSNDNLPSDVSSAIGHTYLANTKDPKQFSYEFSVPKDGDYYIGLWAYSDYRGNYGVYVDDVTVKETALVPVAPSDFKAQAAEKGEMKVNLSWINPSVTNSGNQLDAISSIKITCGSREINLDNPDYLTPGASVNYTDIIPEGTAAGKFTYKLAAYLGSNGSDEVTVTTGWVGLDKPKNVSNFKATISEDNKNVATLSWEQPTDGQNGGYVDLNAVRYRIERNSNPLVTKYTGTSYTDSEEKEYGNYQYTVYVTDDNDVEVGPTYGRGSATLLMGYGLNLPYYNDFENSNDFNLFKYDASSYSNSGWSRTSNYVNGSYTNALEAKQLTSYYNLLDAWMFTPPFILKAGKDYAISFDTWGSSVSETNNINIQISLAEGNAKENVTSTIGDAIVASSATKNNVYYFNVEEDGGYNIAFHALFGNTPDSRTTYYAYLDNLKIEEVVETPMAPENLIAIPDADGAKQVKLSWTNPVNNITGSALSDNLSKIEIYRNEDETPAVILSESQYLEPGKKISYLDVLPENMQEDGYVTYTVKPYLGENTKDFATVKTWVGLETPKALDEVALSGSNGAYILTWSNAEGEHGTTLDPDKVKFEISRILNGESELLTSEATGNEYTDDFSTEELASLQYEVSVIYADNKSAATQSNILKVGFINLPFADSFAGAEIDPMKWENERINGTYDWQAAAMVGQHTGNLTTSSIDNDGGLAFYNFYNAYNNYSARLMTMPISKSSTKSPVLDFYLYRGPGYPAKTNERIQIQISVDGKDWVDVEEGTYYRIAREGDPAEGVFDQWQHYNLAFGSYLPEEYYSYRLAFTTVSENGSNMAIDAVRIFNVADADLAISNLVAPETVIAGNDLELTFKVNNNGQDVKADEYSIAIETDFPAEISIESVDIASLETQDFKFSIPVTAEEAFNLSEYNFKATINFDKDEVVENNESEISVKTGFSKFNEPKNLVADKDEDTKVITLTWDTAKDLTYEPVNIVESFEDFEDGATGPYNGFVTIDADKIPGQRYAQFNLPESSEFVIAKPTQYEAPLAGLDGVKAISAGIYGASGRSATQNDWIISPAINCAKAEDATLNLNFSIMFAATSSYDFSYEVLYATEDYSEENPASSFIVVKPSANYKTTNKFEEVTVTGIPGKAKYIAIHLKSSAAGYCNLITVIDNIRITENDEAPLLGYHVYERNNGRITEESLGEDVLEHVISDEPSAIAEDEQYRYFYVTAIYKDGESRPSNLSGVVTEVKEILAAGTSIAPVSGGVLVNGHDGEIAEVYTLDGRRVASMRCTEHTIISLASGVYVVRAGNESAKVVVK